jgi:hypothetical protein
MQRALRATARHDEPRVPRLLQARWRRVHARARLLRHGVQRRRVRRRALRKRGHGLHARRRVLLGCLLSVRAHVPCRRHHGVPRDRRVVRRLRRRRRARWRPREVLRRLRHRVATMRVRAGSMLAVGALCSQSSDCCRGTCAPGAGGASVCTAACIANGASCSAGADCCSDHCNGAPGTCGAATSCRLIGATCGVDGDCCSGQCVGGSCGNYCHP